MTFRKKIACRLLALCTAFTALPLGVPTVSAANPVTNLVAGLPYTTETGVDITDSYMQSGGETPNEEGKLTDGKFASKTSLDYGDAQYNHFYRGFTRSVIFELPTVKAVTGFAVSLLQHGSAGLPMPPSFDLYVSENGTDYMLAASYDTTSLQGVTSKTYREIKATDLGRFRAKFVKLTFRCEVSVYIDEIEVYGNDPDGTEAAFVKTEPQAEIGAYDAGIEGCREMVLLYCGYRGKYTDDYVDNTEEKLLPYFAYIDEKGNILDSFFDSVMYTALQGAAPSGGNYAQNGGGQTTKEDWEYFLGSLFSEEFNCGAIERIMDRVNAVTGKNEQISLVINMPYPTIGGSAFGDINGDGKAEYCRNMEEQLAIYTWLFDRVEQILAERQYKNIRFGGYYWGAEGLNPEKEQSEEALVRAVADRIHARNTYLFWIPYLYGNGFNRVRDLGFDCAMMQPNYAFLEYSKDSCFDGIDKEIKKYGLGIEIEVKWSALDKDEDLGRYYTYLNAGAALGYQQNTAHSYYQNAAPGTFYLFAKSNVYKLRKTYEDTYAFVKRQYQPREVRLLAKTSVETDAGKTTKGRIRLDSGCFSASLGNPVWTVEQEPANGTVEVNQEGVYAYTPAEGFVGTDSFSICLKAAYASSEVLTFEVNVLGDSEQTVSDGSSSEETSAEISADSSIEPAEKKGLPVLPIAIAGGVLAAAVIGGLAVMLLKKKKQK